MTLERDPLVGQREAINAGRKTRLVWADKGDGKGWPVEIGQVFNLRSCHIEITHRHRIHRNGKWTREAEFVRYEKNADRVHLLGKSGGYTTRAELAMQAQDDPDAATLVRLETPGEQREPEPEGVPPHEIGNYAIDSQAQARRQRELAQDRAAFDALPLEDQLRQLSDLAKERHVDISSDQRVVKKRVEAMKRKVLPEAA